MTSEDSQSRVDGLAQSNAEDNGALQAALAKADAGPAAPRLPGIAATGVLQPLDPFADQTASTTQRARTTTGGLSLAAFLQFKWTIACTGLLIACASVPAIWWLIIPEYRARATVEILPSNPRVLYRTEDNSIPYHQQYLNSQPSVIRGVTVLKRVLEQPAVKQTRWYSEPKTTLLGNPVSRLEALKDALLAEPRPGTYLIDISMRARDPRDAEVIANELVEQYLAFAREKSQETNDAVYQRLTESRRTLEADMEKRKAVTSELQRQLGAATSADVIPRSKTWLEDRQAKLDELRRDIATSEWQEQALVALLEPDAKADPNGTSQPVPAGPRYADDADWRRLHVELKTVRHEIEANSAQLGNEHPDRIALVKKAELLEDLLHEQQDRLDEQFRVYGGKPPSPTGAVSSPASELAVLRRRIGLLKKQEELLVADIQRRESEYERTFESAKVLDKENDALRYEAEKFDLVRRRIDEKETESSMFVLVRSVAAAFAPSMPDQDRRALLTGAALFAALLSGLGVAYLRICVSPAVREMADLTTTSPPPFLGNLPLLRRPDHPDAREAAMQSECIRMVRTALLQRLNGSRGSAVVVTSAGPGVGKTTVTGLLARSLAQLGKNVLVVDADLRKPALCRSLGVTPGAGLIDVLRSAESPAANGRERVWDQDAIVTSDPAGLDVMPAGRVVHARDTELLATAAFTACLDRWSKSYDVVLLDSPPVLPVADARILARQAAGTVLVIREGHCRRAEIVDALASLGMSGAKMLGTVFIGSARLNGYRRTYYDYALPGGVGVAALDVRGG